MPNVSRSNSHLDGLVGAHGSHVHKFHAARDAGRYDLGNVHAQMSRYNPRLENNITILRLLFIKTESKVPDAPLSCGLFLRSRQSSRQRQISTHLRIQPQSTPTIHSQKIMFSLRRVVKCVQYNMYYSIASLPEEGQSPCHSLEVEQYVD